jgi:tRNA modification GTPase
LTAIDLKDALDALGEIVGETAREDILEQIFSRFCIGK